MIFDGPHSISSNRQVALPVRALEALGLAPSQEVYFFVSEEQPSVIQVVPRSLALDWIARGRQVGRTGGKKRGGA